MSLMKDRHIKNEAFVHRSMVPENKVLKGMDLMTDNDERIGVYLFNYYCILPSRLFRCIFYYDISLMRLANFYLHFAQRETTN